MADELIPEGEVADEVIPEPEPFTLPEDFATQVQAWEVPLDKLPEAVEHYKRLQTEDGTIEAFIASGQSLGFGLKELNRLFDEDTPPPAAAPAAPAPVTEDTDPDRLMTAAEVEAIVAGVRKEQEEFANNQRLESFQARQKQVFAAMDNWFDQNEVADLDTRRAIAARGERHIAAGQDSYDPHVALAALERGKAEYDAWVEAEAQAYLKRKAGKASAQPTPVGGGQTHGGGGDEAPVDYAELGQGALSAAKQKVRDRLRQNGDLV